MSSPNHPGERRSLGDGGSKIVQEASANELEAHFILEGQHKTSSANDLDNKVQRPASSRPYFSCFVFLCF